MLLAARQPAQFELLRARLFPFVEPQMDTPEAQRLVKNKPNTLLTGLLGPPARATSRNQRRLNRVRRLLGRELDLRHAIEVQPTFIRTRSIFGDGIDYCFAHRILLRIFLSLSWVTSPASLIPDRRSGARRSLSRCRAPSASRRCGRGNTWQSNRPGSCDSRR